MNLSPVTIATRTPLLSSVRPQLGNDATGHLVEDSVNFGGYGATTAGIAAASSALAPVGTGAGHALGVLGYGAVAGVVGALAGAFVGDAVTQFAARVSGVDHSPDELIAGPVVGGLAGGVAGAGAALASGFFGVSPAASAFIAGGVVLGFGIAATVLDAIQR